MRHHSLSKPYEDPCDIPMASRKKGPKLHFFKSKVGWARCPTCAGLLHGLYGPMDPTTRSITWETACKKDHRWTVTRSSVGDVSISKTFKEPLSVELLETLPRTPQQLSLSVYLYCPQCRTYLDNSSDFPEGLRGEIRNGQQRWKALCDHGHICFVTRDLTAAKLTILVKACHIGFTASNIKRIPKKGGMYQP